MLHFWFHLTCWITWQSFFICKTPYVKLIDFSSSQNLRISAKDVFKWILDNLRKYIGLKESIYTPRTSGGLLLKISCIIILHKLSRRRKILSGKNVRPPSRLVHKNILNTKIQILMKKETILLGVIFLVMQVICLWAYKGLRQYIILSKLSKYFMNIVDYYVDWFCKVSKVMGPSGQIEMLGLTLKNGTSTSDDARALTRWQDL